MHFELRRNILQDLAFILANAVFRSAAGNALLVGLTQVMLVPKVRQLIEVEFSATATTCGYCARQLWLWLTQRSRCVGGFEIEQMEIDYLAPFPKSGSYCFWGVARPPQ